MGGYGSKHGENEALVLCRDRVQCIKQAIDSRYALSAAHLSYIQSLRNVGIALRRFMEAELLNEPLLSTSELEKSPSHSSYATPSPSHAAHHVGSPRLSGSPLSPRLSNVSYMRVGGNKLLTVTVNPLNMQVSEQETKGTLSFPVPEQPPPLETGSPWDFFTPTTEIENLHIQKNEKGCNAGVRSLGPKKLNEDTNPSIEAGINIKSRVNIKSINGVSGGEKGIKSGSSCIDISDGTMVSSTFPAICKTKGGKSEVEEEVHTEMEDASEFITHRAKDLLSSIREIEYRFLRAADSGHEISRMLETNKITLGAFYDTGGKSTASLCLSAAHPLCCKQQSVLELESFHHATKVITWKRSTSSVSSSSKKPFALTSKDEISDNGSDFIEDFCMISGSHSSTLDRLYAWERKLYDEVKTSESIWKSYDQKCSQLRHQNAKDMSAQVVDKTRAVVKDLHSRLMVAIHAVNSISKRIEGLRDDELQPQLLELLQGLIRMWKAILECHHAQYITISLAYHVKNSIVQPRGEAYSNALIHLRDELGCFSSSLLHWVDAQKSYVGSLDTWIQKCIVQPLERSKGRKVTFPPHWALVPPIFVLCRDWLAEIKLLPYRELNDSIQEVVSILRESFEQSAEEKHTENVPIDTFEQSAKEMHIEKGPDERENSIELENKEKVEKCGRNLNLECLQASLTGFFDRSTKFSEASLKVYEEVKQRNEAARIAYTTNGLR